MKRLLLAVALVATIAATANAQYHSRTYRMFQAAGPQLEQTGTIDGLYSKAKNPMLGIGCECLDRDYGTFSKYKDYVGVLGAGKARIQSGWMKTERQKGTYSFEWLDEIVDGLRAMKVRPWMCLCYGNPLYNCEPGLNAKLFTDEETLQAWDRYVRATVTRYKDKVSEWEVWNEPDNTNIGNKPADYVNLFVRTAQIIREIDPEAKIIGMGLCFPKNKWGKEVLEILKEQGKTHLMDYVSFHLYYRNPDLASADVRWMENLLKDIDPRIGLWQGESGCPANLEWTHAMHTYDWNEYKQAKWVLRRMANDYCLGINSSIFTMMDLVYTNMQQSFGLLRGNLLHDVVYRRPAYYAFQHMAYLLEGWEYAGDFEVKHNSGREITAKGFSRDGGKTVEAMMLWQSDKNPTDSLEWDEVTIDILGWEMDRRTKPVLVDILTGKVYDLKTYRDNYAGGGHMRWEDFPIWDSPVLIMRKNDVKLNAKASSSESYTPLEQELF